MLIFLAIIFLQLSVFRSPGLFWFIINTETDYSWDI